jgi:hypothetical protein
LHIFSFLIARWRLLDAIVEIGLLQTTFAREETEEKMKALESLGRGRRVRLISHYTFGAGCLLLVSI